ncbi:hypothetical protein INH39_16630 [Massilia violaceinigra]|uniref:Uncharacterized protein n=1 Tax=Massilia violaceinigra TaxID=2045208 RepID=A0ABY4AEI7_9BURK|nr:hypothetical protein [Massilia violaceinigra]UOD33118.1 hypothetical protein INH39_16630 [Massilia violaceinigra]
MSFLRAVVLLIALIAMVGIGACGVLGLYLAAHSGPAAANELLVFGLIGVTLSAMLGWGIYRRLRKAAAPPQSEQ